MNWTERRERFRALLADKSCVHPGSVYDAISARIAEDLGFEVGMFSGSVGSMAVLGAPDLVVLTLSEFAAQAYRICRAGNLALLVDADHGYGNALNVRRTVEELETAGICAMSIEDTVLPRPYGPSGKPTLSSIEEGVGKMKAALSARQDKRLVIAGRTSALAIAGVDEAIKRARAYEAAGVDAVFLAGGVTAEADRQVNQLGGRRGCPAHARGLRRRVERQKGDVVTAGRGQRQMPCPQLGLVDDVGEAAMHRSALARRGLGVNTPGQQGMGEVDPVAVDRDDALAFRVLEQLDQQVVVADRRD